VRQEQAQVLLRALPPQPRRALRPRLASCYLTLASVRHLQLIDLFFASSPN
jgi:hypothetical protein